MVVRTCIGCRQRAAATELVRFVLADSGKLLVDEGKSLPGRGAHLHPTTQCLEQAERRKAFYRALKSQKPVDISELVDLVRNKQTTDRLEENGAPAHEHSMSTSK